MPGGKQILLSAWLLCLLTAVLKAADGPVVLRFSPVDVGLTGVYRPGSWLPIRLELENRSSQPRRILCEWSWADPDGDIVAARRLATLNPGPGAVQWVWLYAPMPLSASSPFRAQIRLIELPPDADLTASTGHLLTRQTVLLPGSLAPHIAVVGILGPGAGTLGLEVYEKLWTRHEARHIVTDLIPAQLPDRWYGLEMLETLIWTPRAGDPSAPEIPSAVHEAIRQWVWQGGHLIILWPAVGDPWSSSPLADLLPLTGTDIGTLSELTVAELPSWLGAPVRETTDRFALRWFAVPDNQPDRVAVLLRDRAGYPVVITAQRGLGRVTLIGIDLTDSRLARVNLPNSITADPDPVGRTLWASVFGWRGPVYSEATATAMGLDRLVSFRVPIDLDTFVADCTAMRRAVTPALLVTVSFLALYWFIAGPIGFLWLSRRGWTTWAWPAFGLTVLVFVVLCWGSAALLAPMQPRVAHFSFLDFDLASGVVRGRSWFSIFARIHEPLALQLGGAPEYAASSRPLPVPARSSQGASSVIRQSDTLAAAAVSSDQQPPFLDVQRYLCDAASPDHLRVPMRATAKLLQAAFLLDAQKGAGEPVVEEFWRHWPRPRGSVRLIDGVPVGRLVHDLPGTLRDVLVVYSPGAFQHAWVWRPRQRHWEPGKPLEITGLSGQPLLTEPSDPASGETSRRVWGGHLGDLVQLVAPSPASFQWQRPSPPQPVQTISDDQMIRNIEMLCLFDLLPPPLLPSQEERFSMIPTFSRSLGRWLDISSLLALRRIVIIGHLDTRFSTPGPLPMPLSVPLGEVPASGWTVVRLIVPVEE